jgi:hypothetical protein
MLSALMGLLGFAAPFLPEVFKLFNRSMDLRHEKEMLTLQMQKGAQESTWRLAEVNAKADADVEVAIRQPQQSFGIQLLDKAAALGWSKGWLLPAFYLFCLLDFMTGMVRNTVTYMIVGAYCLYKWANYMLLTGPRFENAPEGAIVQLWTQDDFGVLLMVLGFWFGDRVRKAVFGGAARSN